jgi:hypothetical protein
MPERLLYFISTRGKVSFVNFDAALKTVYSQIYKISLEDINFTRLRYQTLRFLDALGHCDVDFGKRFIYACPPSLVFVPCFGLPKALLTGARNQELVMHIKKYVAENKNAIRFHRIAQRHEHSLLPMAIYLEAISTDLLKGAASKVGITLKTDEPAAWDLINFSSNISEVGNNMSFDLRTEPDWPKRIFSLSNLAFSKYITINDSIRIVEYTNPRDQQRLHWLWQGDKAADVDRDWGRFLVLHKQNINVLLYDSKRFLLAIPANIPLPRLISRALILCTGRAPSEDVLQGKPVMTIPENCHFHIYDAVVPSIAEVISNKLGQELISYNLKVKDGVLS